MVNIEIIEVNDQKYKVHYRIQNPTDEKMARMKEIYKHSPDFYFLRSKKDSNYLICTLIEDADFSDID